ncbi:MAG: hypothetical protein IT235_04310 [Bacteroidia bacterium]|nr:hypothetical protein [Bacteroidia bacterium]
MLRIREVKTNSGGIAVQVICYQNRKRIVVEHIGTAHKDEDLEQLYRCDICNGPIALAQTAIRSALYQY